MAEAAPLTKCSVLGSAALAMWELMLFQNKIPTEFSTELMKIIKSRKRQHCELISAAVLHACNIQEAVSDQTWACSPSGMCMAGDRRHSSPPTCPASFVPALALQSLLGGMRARG